MKPIIRIAVVLCALVTGPQVFAQNTLEGTLAQVPEAEVNRQSAFLDAERERILEHWEKAESLFKDFLRTNPENDAAWYSLARVQVGREAWGDALESIRKAVRLNPANSWYAVFEADLLEENGQTGAAAAVYEKLIKQTPENPGYYNHLAYLYTLDARPKEALKTLDKLEKQTGFHPEIAEKKFLLLKGMGETDKAAAELQRLISAFPHRMAYRYKLAAFYEETGDAKKARQAYESILKIDPQDPVALLATAGAQDALLGNPRMPLDDKLKQLIPELEDFRLQPSPEKQSRLQQAAGTLENTHPDDPRTWSFSGDVYYLTDQAETALEKYRKCLDFPNAPYSVWANVLEILYTRQQDEELLESAEKAMDAWPNQPESYLYYGLSAIRLGRNADAIPMLQQAKLMTARSSDAALRNQIQQALDTAQKKN